MSCKDPNSPTRSLQHPGDLRSHFQGKTIDGRDVPYQELWQRRNLPLFVGSPELQVAASSNLMALNSRLSELKPSHCAIDGVPMKSLAIADCRGEIVHAVDLPSDPVGWPSIDDVEWVEFVRMKCPVCPPYHSSDVSAVTAGPS